VLGGAHVNECPSSLFLFPPAVYFCLRGRRVAHPDRIIILALTLELGKVAKYGCQLDGDLRVASGHGGSCVGYSILMLYCNLIELE
jgi:hypothetical protein